MTIVLIIMGILIQQVVTNKLGIIAPCRHAGRRASKNGKTMNKQYLGMTAYRFENPHERQAAERQVKCRFAPFCLSGSEAGAP